MRGEKNVIYENSLGQRLVFDNRQLFIEYIDMIGTTGIHAAESLASADGQTSVYHQLGAKTIPCSFALKNINLDDYTKLYLESIFNPKLSGTLTVITKNDVYKIECRPQNFPTFKRDEVKFVYRFDVDFVADFRFAYENRISGRRFNAFQCQRQGLHPESTRYSSDGRYTEFQSDKFKRSKLQPIH